MANRLYINRAQLHATGMKEANSKVRRVVRRTDTRSAILAPVDTGNLRSNRSTGVKATGSAVRGEVVYHAEYAAAVHNGRRALTIRARAGGRLRFVVDGQVVYAREVHQPARAGRPFLTTALREVAIPEGFRVTRR